MIATMPRGDPCIDCLPVRLVDRRLDRRIDRRMDRK
jgi:hypothetical protein